MTTNSRFSRCLSALIVEEFIYAQNRQDIITGDPSISLKESQSLQTTNPPRLSSRASSPQSLLSPTSRRQSLEEPPLAPRIAVQHLPEVHSHRPWRQNLQRANSPDNSLHSNASESSYQHRTGSLQPRLPPDNNHFRIKHASYDTQQRRTQQRLDHSDDGFSSTRNSLSEGLPDLESGSRPISLQERGDIVVRKPAEDNMLNIVDSSARSTLPLRALSENEPTAQPYKQRQNSSLVAFSRILGRRVGRTSLPDPDRVLAEHEQRRHDVDEVQLNHEYEVKAQLACLSTFITTDLLYSLGC
jgi:hypothetical protein